MSFTNKFLKGIILIILLSNLNFLSARNLVLCYHKVGYSLDDIYFVLPEMLEEQVKIIKDLGIEIVGIDYFTNANYSSNYTVSITFDDGWKIPKEIIEFFRKENIRATFFIYPTVIGNKGFFSWNDIINLDKQGFTIGSHSYSHKFLKDLPQETLFQEIVYSKEVIERKLGKEVFAFAYPFGIADKNAYLLTSKTYKISFVVDDEAIKEHTPINKLSRHIIFNHTSIGQFREIIDSIFETSNLDYRVYRIKSKVSPLYSKLYHFPVMYPESTIFIIPSMSVGPSWFMETINKLREFNIESYVFISEIYSFPFYKYEIYYDRIKDISIQTISTSLDKALSLVNKKITIITWGDGMDLLLYTLSQKTYPNIKKIIAINPFLSNTTSKKEILDNITIYKNLLSKGKYDFESFRENVRISVLIKLALLKPYDKTPFKTKFGDLNNLQAFINHLNSNKNLKIKLISEKILDYIKQIEYSPFYPFSVVEPISYYLGINRFWLNGYTNQNLPKLSIFYSDDFKNNLDKLKTQKKVENFGNLSTIEIFISDKLIVQLLNEIKNQ